METFEEWFQILTEWKLSYKAKRRQWCRRESRWTVEDALGMSVSSLYYQLVLSVSSTSDSYIYICEICTQVLDWNLPSIEFYKRRGVTINWQPISPAFICWAAKLPQNYHFFCRHCFLIHTTPFGSRPLSPQNIWLHALCHRCMWQK